MIATIPTLPYADMYSDPPVHVITSVYVRNFPTAPQVKQSSPTSANQAATVTSYTTVDEFLQHYIRLIKIRSDASLWPEGAEGPSPVAIELANSVLSVLKSKGVPPTKVVASGEGGVGICFVSGEKYADIECLNTGEILGVTTNRRDRPNVWSIDENSSDVEKAALRISQFLDTRKTKKNVSGRSRNR